jgi:hypothetical protein
MGVSDPGILDAALFSKDLLSLSTKSLMGSSFSISEVQFISLNLVV